MRIFQGFLADERGQDLIEYALMAMFVAVAVGALMPDIVGAVAAVQRRLVILLGGQPVASMTVLGLDFATLRIIYAVVALAALLIIVLRRKRRSKYDSWLD